jgi:hypothetical protein
MTDEQIYNLVVQEMVTTRGRVMQAISIVADRCGLKDGGVQSSYYRHKKLLNLPPKTKDPLKPVLDKLDLIEALLNELLERSDA